MLGDMFIEEGEQDAPDQVAVYSSYSKCKFNSI